MCGGTGQGEKSPVQSRKCRGFTTAAEHYICKHHLSLPPACYLLSSLCSIVLLNCLVKVGKWWMLQKNERAVKKKKHMPHRCRPSWERSGHLAVFHRQLCAVASEVPLAELHKPRETDTISWPTQTGIITFLSRNLFYLGGERRERRDGGKINKRLLNILGVKGHTLSFECSLVRLCSYKTCSTKADEGFRVSSPPGMTLIPQWHLCTFRLPCPLARSWLHTELWPWQSNRKPLSIWSFFFSMTFWPFFFSSK